MESYKDKMQSYFKSHGKIKDYNAASSKIHSVAWNCDGKRLAAGSMDKTVTVFMLENYRLVSVTGLGDNRLNTLAVPSCQVWPCGIISFFGSNLKEFILCLSFDL